MSPRGWLALIGSVLAFACNGPYIRDTWLGKTKPHAFSWLTWFAVDAIACAAQISGSAGAGAWITGISASTCLIVVVLALFRGEQDIAPLDWVFLGAAAFAVVPWLLSNDATVSVVLVTLIDALAFAPTFRKSYLRPHEETVSMYLFASLGLLFGVAALEHYSIATTLYMASGVCNAGFLSMLLLVRRRQLPRPHARGPEARASQT